MKDQQSTIYPRHPVTPKLRFGIYLDPKNIPLKHCSPQEVFAWMSRDGMISRVPWVVSLLSRVGLVINGLNGL